MVVPVGVVDLREADTALHQPAREQAVVGERGPARRRGRPPTPSEEAECKTPDRQGARCATHPPVCTPPAGASSKGRTLSTAIPTGTIRSTTETSLFQPKARTILSRG